MKILAISGSLRDNSYNTALLKNAAGLAPVGMEVNLFGRLADIPLFKADLAEGELPQSVIELRREIDEAEALLISTPEYAHGVSGSLKNTLDWLVSFEEIVLKPIVVMSASTTELGGFRAIAPLILVLNAMNTNVLIEATLCVPFCKSKFDGEGRLLDALSAQRLENSLAMLGRHLD